jgi:cellulose synthase/poly-beta-1,6-N-acetylglucosamine synthase-like glycosyltransferase
MMLTMTKDNKVTIVLPVSEETEVVDKFVNSNKEILKKHSLLVVDKKGGDILKGHATFYRKTSCPTIGWPLGSSRRFLIRRVQTEFTLNMDVDVMLPTNFIQESLKKFKDPQVAAVALDYEKPQGHLAFGPSIWRTKLLQKLYDWEYLKTGKCECLYMWAKLRKAEYKLETLDMSAKHIKSWGDSITLQRRGRFQNCAWNVLRRLLGGIRRQF